MNKKDALVEDVRRIASKLKRPPLSRLEYEQAGGKFKEWEFRKRGGFDLILEKAGFDSHAIQLVRLRSENERLSKRLDEAEDIALGSSELKKLIGSLSTQVLDADPDWMRGAANPKGVKGMPILLLSDIHFDEVVRAEQIGGCNAFNREIGIRRIKNTFRNTIKLLKGHMTKPHYEGIVCNLGGDLLSGNIHEELAETNEATINQSIIALSELLIEGIGGLADEFGRVHVPCVTGNHGRMHKKPRAKNRAFENHEWMIYQFIAKYFKGDSRITFQIPDGPDAQYKVYKRNYLLTHGDQFSGGGGVGGIMVPIMRGMLKKADKQQAIGKPFDVMMIGHWHQYIHTDRLIINGSVKGYDEYASANNFSYEPPQQALWIEHAEDRMTFRMPILCDKST
jgi:hypothetical protein